MKELTIEEKAKAYDKIIGIAKKELDACGSQDCDAARQIFRLFPELKESEGEKIRKSIISGMTALKEQGKKTFATIPINDCIDWLEKQGDKIIDCSQNHKDMNNPNGCIVLEDFNGGDGFYKVHLDYLNKKQVEEVEEMVRAWNKESNTSDDNIKSCIGICLTDADEQRFKDFGTSLKECLDWLERQGEQKETLCDKCRKEQPSHSCQDIIALGRCALEKQGEKKPIDKVEPKFNVGEWVILTAGELSTTLQIVKVDTNQKLYWFNDSSYLPIVDEECLQIWTIQDARDGDVLICGTDKRPFIFKGLLDINHPDYPVAYCGINSERVFRISSETHWWTSSNVQPATKEQRELLFQKMKEAGYEWDTEKKELKKIEQKSWSGEDECILNGILADYKSMCKTYRDWLESLKNRIQPQPKQEWSEEDEDNFKHLLDEIVCLGNNRNSSNRLYYDRLIKFIEELKNRAQPKEKWCDKDERMLDRLIVYFEKQVAFTDDDNPRYANWLKCLKERYSWKPSDEQMKALKGVQEGVFRIGLLESLYNDLLKLKE